MISPFSTDLSGVYMLTIYILLVPMKEAVTEWPETTGSISVLNDAAQEILTLMLAEELMLEE
jgi:hypothetical protein